MLENHPSYWQCHRQCHRENVILNVNQNGITYLRVFCDVEGFTKYGTVKYHTQTYGD